MPNDWVDDKPKDAGWLDKPVGAAPLKTLEDLGTERQKAAEAPKLGPPEPLPASPEEDIDYAKAASDLESAAQDALLASSRLDRGIFSLNKISISVSADGPKGKELLDRTKDFQSRMDTARADLMKVCEEIADYKKSLPKAAAAI